MTSGKRQTLLIRATPADGTLSLIGRRKCLRLLPKVLIALSQNQMPLSRREHTLSGKP